MSPWLLVLYIFVSVIRYSWCVDTIGNKVQVRLEPLMDLINRVKDLPVPNCEAFPAWEARAAKAARENGDLNPNDPSRSQGGYGSTLMPFIGETKVIVSYTCQCI